MTRTAEGFLREGEQFELDLFPGVPWGGRSPRGLTRVQISLSLRRELPRHEVMDERDPMQTDLWLQKGHTDEEVPATGFIVGGTPSLLPLRSSRKFGSSRRGSRKWGDHG